jgi:photosystem II stability/assembly factor-like uncharacterized protein
VAIGDNGIISTSTDGEAWETHEIAPYNDNYYGLYNYNGRWMAVGDNGIISTSTNGETWTTQTVGSNSYYSVYNNGGRWIAIGGGGIIATSTDGETWATREIVPYSDNYYIEYNSVYNNGGRWIAIGYAISYDYNYRGVISTSTEITTPFIPVKVELLIITAIYDHLSV